MLAGCTLAAPCAGRTVAGVIAIRAYPGGKDPERKSSRQFQRGLKLLRALRGQESGVRTHGLRTQSFYVRHGRTYLRRALPLAVFPPPRRPLCWIPIKHRVAWMRAPCSFQRSRRPGKHNPTQVDGSGVGGVRANAGGRESWSQIGCEASAAGERVPRIKGFVSTSHLRLGAVGV
jgi:hypothetical protein